MTSEEQELYIGHYGEWFVSRIDKESLPFYARFNPERFEKYLMLGGYYLTRSSYDRAYDPESLTIPVRTCINLAARSDHNLSVIFDSSDPMNISKYISYKTIIL